MTPIKEALHKHFDLTTEAFKKDPTGSNWADLASMMWVLQGLTCIKEEVLVEQLVKSIMFKHKGATYSNTNFSVNI